LQFSELLLLRLRPPPPRGLQQLPAVAASPGMGAKQRAGKAAAATQRGGEEAATTTLPAAATPLKNVVQRARVLLDRAARLSPQRRAQVLHAAAWLALMLVYMRTRYAGISGGDSVRQRPPHLSKP
jgi:hypothetical protein